MSFETANPAVFQPEEKDPPSRTRSRSRLIRGRSYSQLPPDERKAMRDAQAVTKRTPSQVKRNPTLDLIEQVVAEEEGLDIGRYAPVVVRDSGLSVQDIVQPHPNSRMCALVGSHQNRSDRRRCHTVRKRHTRRRPPIILSCRAGRFRSVQGHHDSATGAAACLGGDRTPEAAASAT